MANPVVTSDWAYADWQSKITLAERLAAATLHDAEVRRAAVEQGTGKGRYTRLPESYVRDLAKEITTMRSELQLQESIAAERAASRRRPVHFRPRF